MNLEHIGFYTLSDARIKNLSHLSPMKRGEIILTTRCNFSCHYCRGGSVIKSDAMEDINFKEAVQDLVYWARDGLENVRFSGGEPTMYRQLSDLVTIAKALGVRRVAISSNGSASIATYIALLKAGANDFSISLDACCASGCNKMSGKDGYYERVIDNIHWLAARVYTTVGVVLTDENINDTLDIINLAADLGVSDIRIIPSAQENKSPVGLADLPETLLERFPILRYRVSNFLAGRNVRGISNPEDNRCYIVLDDSAIAGHHHFPCIIYMREGGEPIGLVGPNMRAERIKWSQEHNVYEDPICRANCLDCIVQHNQKARTCHGNAI